jgi:hypothetical protein
MVSLPLNT